MTRRVFISYQHADQMKARGLNLMTYNKNVNVDFTGRHLLDPVKTWKDKAEFDQTARKLVGMFQHNFTKFEKHVDADVRAAAPEVRLAAE